MGCQTTGNSPDNSAPENASAALSKVDLVGSQWELSNLTAKSSAVDFDATLAPTLEFLDELMAGNSGCNTYRTPWKLGESGELSFSGPMMQTRKACQESIMALENQFIEVLSGANSVSVNGETLTINSENGVLIFAQRN